MSIPVLATPRLWGLAKDRVIKKSPFLSAPEAPSASDRKYANENLLTSFRENIEKVLLSVQRLPDTLLVSEDLTPVKPSRKFFDLEPAARRQNAVCCLDTAKRHLDISRAKIPVHTTLLKKF